MKKITRKGKRDEVAKVKVKAKVSNVKKNLAKQILEKEMTVQLLQSDIADLKAELSELIDLNEVVDIGLDNKVFSKWKSRVVTLPPKPELIRKLGVETFVKVSSPSITALNAEKGDIWINKHCSVDYRLNIGWRKK